MRIHSAADPLSRAPLPKTIDRGGEIARAEREEAKRVFTIAGPSDAIPADWERENQMAMPPCMFTDCSPSQSLSTDLAAAPPHAQPQPRHPTPQPQSS